MEKAKILQSFHPPEGSLQGLAWVKGDIWIAGAKAGRIYRQQAIRAGAYETLSYIPCPVKNPGGMTWDGADFLVSDRFDKVIFKVNPASGLATKVLTLAELKKGEKAEVFQAKASQVTDIAWGQEHLWVAAQAGYSSSVYRIDLKAKSIVQHFYARGPKPEGVSFDAKGEFLWTVDASNQEFSQFTQKGEWTDVAVSSPVKKPSGLALDDQEAFWTSDQESGQVYQIKREV
jgi:sugar lactone lactonase YvrE